MSQIVRSRTIRLGMLVVLGFLTEAVAQVRPEAGPNIGDAAPKFQSTDDRGQPWSSESFAGKSYLAVYFYPADFTTGCTKQAEQFRDTMNLLADSGVTVIGVSGDSAPTHALFKTAWRLNYSLLADETGDLARAFGVPQSAGGRVMPHGPDRKPLLNESGERFRVERKTTHARWTFVIGRDGTILYKNTKVRPVDDAQQVLEFIKALEREESYALVDKAAQDLAVAGITSRGGKVEYDESSPIRPVVSVQILGCGVRDEDLVWLKSFPALRVARLGHGITDAGLEHLRDLEYLEVVTFPGARVTGPGLVYLKDLPRLQELDLENTEITDDALTHLQAMKRLRSLNLTETDISDAGLQHLKGLTRLESLNLYYVQTPLTDAIAPILAGLPHLKQLDLAGASLTDAGLQLLTTLKSLKSINIENTSVTDDGVQKLRDALRNVEIVR